MPDAIAGNYVDAIDPDQYLIASRPLNNQRWRVRDNLPGTREFCPLVTRTEAVREVEAYSCAAALQSLEVQFGAELLLRSANWLSHKESRASFLIEHEEQHVDRVRRFAAAMGRRCGEGGDPLQEEVLTQLQEEILGKATRYGLRKSPVFVGHNDAFISVIDYIAPQWKDARELLALRDLERARAAVKNRLEGPDADIDAIIRSLRQNGWQLSGSLKKRFPQFEDSRLATLIIDDLRAVFEPGVATTAQAETDRDPDDPRSTS